MPITGRWQTCGCYLILLDSIKPLHAWPSNAAFTSCRLLHNSRKGLFKQLFMSCSPQRLAPCCAGRYACICCALLCCSCTCPASLNNIKTGSISARWHTLLSHHAAAGMSRARCYLHDACILEHNSLRSAIYDCAYATVCLLRCVSAEGVPFLPVIRAMGLLFVMYLDSMNPHTRPQHARI